MKSYVNIKSIYFSLSEIYFALHGCRHAYSVDLLPGCRRVPEAPEAGLDQKISSAVLRKSDSVSKSMSDSDIRGEDISVVEQTHKWTHSPG